MNRSKWAAILAGVLAGLMVVSLLFGALMSLL